MLSHPHFHVIEVDDKGPDGSLSNPTIIVHHHTTTTKNLDDCAPRCSCLVVVQYLVLGTNKQQVSLDILTFVLLRVASFHVLTTTTTPTTTTRQRP